MKPHLLLDTHVFLWALGAPERLSPKARELYLDADAKLLLSVASVWEIAIKASLGKLTLPEPVKTFIPTRLESQRIDLLPIRVGHAVAVSELPFHHRDPFDRLLAAQAMEERLQILSSDPIFLRYAVERVW
jgi:PIN domain nuclease of toxin-antitoxin system